MKRGSACHHPLSRLARGRCPTISEPLRCWTAKRQRADDRQRVALVTGDLKGPCCGAMLEQRPCASWSRRLGPIAGRRRQSMDTESARGGGWGTGTCRSSPVLEEPGVVEDQRLRADGRFHPPGQPGPDMRRIPRTGADEVGQRLPIAIRPEPSGHRLYRLPLPIGEQAPQVDLPPTDADPYARTPRTPPPRTPPTPHAPQRFPPESHTLNATPNPKDTHHPTPPDQALLLRQVLLLGDQATGDLQVTVRVQHCDGSSSWWSPGTT